MLLRSVSRPTWLEITGLLVAITAYLTVAVLLINLGSPLGHDEALYASRAREFLNGEPLSAWWGPYRAPGLSALLTFAWIGNGTEPYLRFVVALTGVALIVFSWLLGRLIVGRGAAVLAAFGMALSPVFLTSSTLVWPDVPAAALGMAGLTVYAYALRGPRFRPWLVIVVSLLIALSTAFRFGAPVPLAIGLVILTLWAWPSAWERRSRVVAVAVGGSAMAGLVLLTPLFGSSNNAFQAILEQSARTPWSQGFADYWRLRGTLGAGAATVGLLGIAAGFFGSFFDAELRKTFFWPSSIAILGFIAISATVHGEARYLAPVYPWFWLSAGTGLFAIGTRTPRILRTIVASALIVSLTAAAPSLSDGGQEFNMRFSIIKHAARSLAWGGDCGVFTSYTPQVEWYSGCETVNINRSEVVVASPFLPAGPRYLFIVESGKRQPDDDLMKEYVDKTTGQAQVFGHPGGPLQYVEIWELED